MDAARESRTTKEAVIVSSSRSSDTNSSR